MKILGLKMICAVVFLFLFAALSGAFASPPWLSRAMSDVGTNPTGWSHKWCGKALAMWVGGGPNLSTAWASIGLPTSARPGAIAVMNGHVGIVTSAGCDARSCEIVSGNHSGRSGARTVGIGRYSISRIIAFRWPQ